MKLPKSIIKKYGISKKAWSVFRGRGRIKTRSRTMGKRKYFAKRNSASSILGKLNKPAMGALGVVAYEAFLSPRIPVQGVAKDLLELAAGLYLSKKGGIIGATGQSLVVLNSYQLISGLAGKYLPSSVGGNTNNSVYVYG